MIRYIFAILFSLFSLLPTQAKVLSKLYNIDYGKAKLHYFYDDSKFTVRVSGIPNNVDILQVASHNNEKSPKIHIIGKSNLQVEHGAASSFVDFNMQVDKNEASFTQQKASELKFKAFKKSYDEEGNEYFEIIESFSNFVRSRTCSDTVDEVCAVLKRACRPGDSRCLEGNNEVVQSFKNECEMEKHGANLMYTGACADTDLNRN